MQHQLCRPKSVPSAVSVPPALPAAAGGGVQAAAATSSDAAAAVPAFVDSVVATLGAAVVTAVRGASTALAVAVATASYDSMLM